MDKLVLLSLIVMTVALPMRHARNPRPQRALRRAVIEFCWFNLFYVFALVYVVPRVM